MAIVFLLLWVAHYVHRSFIYPFRLRSSRPSMTVSVIAMGAAFNVGNGYLNGRYLFTLGPELQTSWLLDPRFIAGLRPLLARATLSTSTPTRCSSGCAPAARPATRSPTAAATAS